MRFSCDGCSAKYMISDDKVGPGGVKVRCKKCGHVTHVRRGEAGGAAVPAASAAQGSTPSVEWWVAIDEQPVGPVGIEVVQHHWDLGEIGPESLVWYSGLAEWAPISSVPELHGHLSGDKHPPVPQEAPPPPPPPPPVPDDEWRPGAASALAALEDPEPREPAGAPPAAGPAEEPVPAAPPPAETTLAGTDPTGVRPLPMAGLERTGEKRLAGTPGTRGVKVRGREMLPPKESRSLTVVLLVALVVVLAVAGGLWWLTK
jgi:predicted Zn finger-like uncharacterized protein